MHYQLRILNKQLNEINNFSEVEKGLNLFLKGENFNQKFERIRSKIKHFRTLRNQFAHYRYGVFSFSANYESFESFLKNLPGIILGESMWAYLDGKAGVFQPYEISSNLFNKEFRNAAFEFYERLIEILLESK